jgi:hypothetical protein
VAFMVTATLVSDSLTLRFLTMLIAAQVQVFSAWPISNWWTLGKSYTINYGAFITSFAAIDLVLDVVILCLPVPVVRQLQIKTSKKFLITGIFWMGVLVSASADAAGPWLTCWNSCVVATAVRLYFGHQLSLAGSGKPVTDDEFSSEQTYPHSKPEVAAEN